MFILFLCAGIVSAHENNTIYSEDNQNIKDLIDDCEDNGIVTLDEKTYYLSGDKTSIVLNKSVTVEGVVDKTIIDGKGTSLILDVNQTKSKINDGKPIISYLREGYSFKYLGKNVTFKNITFKDVKITTWHEMTFENCKFINSTFTSYEYQNTFKNSIFNKSEIEIVLFYGYGDIYKDYSKIISCNLYESLITFKRENTPNYIEIIGGDQFRITNSLDIKNSNLCKSNITLYRYNITIDNSNFNDSNILSSSSIYNISKSNFNNQKIEASYSKISLYNSNLTNPQLYFTAGYFSDGCKIIMDNVLLSNCTMDGSITFGSRKGSLKIKDSIVNNSTLYTEYSDVSINNSLFNKSSIEFFFADANITNSTFANDGNIEDTIKTRNYNEEYTFDEDGTRTAKKVECQVKTNYVCDELYFVNSTGKYLINSEEINKDTTHKIIINKTSIYYFNDILIIKLENYMGEPVIGQEIFIENLNDEYQYPVPSVKTDKNGIAKYNLNMLGNVSLKIYYMTRTIGYHNTDYGIILNLTVKPTISDIKINKVNFNKNVYSKINARLEIKTVSKISSNLKDIKFAYKIYTNGKTKTYYSKTNFKGKTTFKLPNTLTAGKHKIEVRLLNTKIKKTLTIKIAKAKTIVKAPKVTNKFKKSQYFKITLKNKATKKIISNVKVKIKVYSGKKYKTYTVKTNKKGIAKINTNKLKTGKHNVVISSKNSNYLISAKSMITIQK